MANEFENSREALSDVCNGQTDMGAGDDAVYYNAADQALPQPRAIELNNFIGTIVIETHDDKGRTEQITRTYTTATNVYIPVRPSRVLATGTTVTQGTIIGLH